MIERRALLRLFVGGLAAASASCRPPAAVEPERERPPPAKPDVNVPRLGDVVTSVRLDWLVEVRPEALVGIGWLGPALSKLFQSERLDALAQTTGLDLRHVPELLLAAHAGDRGGDGSVAFVVRHRADPGQLERKFRERLTSEAERREFDHQLVGVWGLVGRALRGFASLGPRVVSYQYGGTRRSGPVRLALLYAEGRLADVPTVTKSEWLTRADTLLGASPLRACLIGPFEGDMARGARGLLASATSVAVSLAPTERETFHLTLVLDGDYQDATAEARLAGAWQDLRDSDLGDLLGLSKGASGGGPIIHADVHARDGQLVLETELAGVALVEGLAAATTANARDFLR